MDYKIMISEWQHFRVEMLVKNELERNEKEIASYKEYEGTEVEEAANALREGCRKKERDLNAILAALKEAECVND